MDDGDKFCAGCGGPRPVVVVEPETSTGAWYAGVGHEVVPLPVEEATAGERPAPPLPAPVAAAVLGGDATGALAAGPVEIKFRLLSWLIDGAIIAVAFMVANAVHQLLGVAVLAGGVFAYYVLLVGGDRHATVGHQVAKLRIVDAESMTPIDVRTASLRAAVNAVLALPFGLPLLLNIPIHSRYQGVLLHDLSTGTKVVRVA